MFGIQSEYFAFHMNIHHEHWNSMFDMNVHDVHGECSLFKNECLYSTHDNVVTVLDIRSLGLFQTGSCTLPRQQVRRCEARLGQIYTDTNLLHLVRMHVWRHRGTENCLPGNLPDS